MARMVRYILNLVVCGLFQEEATGVRQIRGYIPKHTETMLDSLDMGYAWLCQRRGTSKRRWIISARSVRRLPLRARCTRIELA